MSIRHSLRGKRRQLSSILCKWSSKASYSPKLKNVYTKLLTHSPKRILSLVTLFFFLFSPISSLVYAAQIVIDGNTQTELEVHGNVTEVTTSTTRGQNAFNSFHKFDVYAGNVVNLHLPDGTFNLLNLVHSDRTDIHGMLNSIKGGNIGGNIFFANPYGFVFGAESVVNVGSLTALTPTKGFMGSFFDSPGNPSAAATAGLLDGTAPINENALISVEGRINAIGDINLSAGGINNSGIIASGAVFAGDSPDFSDVMNTSGLESGTQLSIQNGNIEILAEGDFNNTGVISTDGADGLDAGNIDIHAGKDVSVAGDAVISARGRGEDSDGGNIIVLADNDTELSGNAVVDVSGGDVSGDAGFIEFSAKEKVTLKGGSFRASDSDGNAGEILIDPNDVEVVSGNKYTDGADYILEANNSITVSPSVIISTRDLNDVNTEDHLTASSTGNSGDLSLDAPAISVGDSAKLLAHVEEGSSFSAGDITLSASDISSNVIGLIVDIEDAEAEISLNNATLKGAGISITAEAGNTQLFDENSTVGDQILDFLENITLIGGVSLATATADVTVGNGSEIDASGDLTISSIARSDSTVNAVSTALGFAYGDSNATANPIVQDGVSINSDNFTLQSEAKTKGHVKIYTVSLGPKPGDMVNNPNWYRPPTSPVQSPIDVAVVVSKADADAKSEIKSGTTVNVAGDLTVEADTIKDLKTKATSGAYDDGTVGIAVAVSMSDATANAYVDGDVTVGNNTVITATNTTQINDVNSSASSGSGLGVQVALRPTATVGNIGSKVTGFFNKKDKTSPKADSKKGGMDFGLAAAVTYADHTNNTTARIGDNAAVTSTGGKVDVVSSITDYVEFSASSFIEKDMRPDPPENSKNYGIAASVAIGDFANNAYAYIGDSADVDASGNILVKSETLLPQKSGYQFDSFSDVTEVLNTNAGVQNLYSNSWAQSNVSTEDLGLAGSVVIFSADNTSEAYIDSDAKINQDIGSYGNVNVEAYSKLETIDISGVFGIKFLGTTTGKGGAGGSYLGLDFTNIAKASVDDGASVKSDDLTVKADSRNKHISVGESGGKSDKVTLNGTFTLTDIENETYAQIDDGAVINALGNVSVSALDETKNYNGAGGLAWGSKLGIGAAVAINDISKRDTKALIGNMDSGSDSATGSLSANGDVDVSAETTGLIGSVSVAVAITTTESPDPSQVKEEPESGGKYGISISGDVALNSMNAATEAYISDSSITKAGSVNVDADSEDDIYAGAGAVAISTSEKSGAIAGSYTQNTIDQKTSAYVDNSTFSGVTGNLDLSSDTAGDIRSLTASGGGAAKAGVAGSVSMNEITHNTLSYIHDSDITNNGYVKLASQDDAIIWSVAGALGYGGKAGFGASVGINTVDITNNAYIEDSDVDTNSYVSLSADSNTDDTDEEILAISMAIGAAPEGAAAAASVSVNNITNDTNAYIKGKKTAQGVDAGSYVRLYAQDDSDIVSEAGAGGIAGKAGLGVSVSTNNIDNSARAYAENTRIDSQSLLSDAYLTGSIMNLTAGGAGAQYFAAGGAVSVNNIADEAEAYIKGSDVTTLSNISLTAEEDAEIAAIAGAVAGAKNVSFGASVSTNNIGDPGDKGPNAVKAYIENSEVTSSAGTLSLTANSDSIIKNITGGGTIAEHLSANAAVSVNNIYNEIDAYIKDATGTKDVTAQGDISLSAEDNSSVSVIAGNIAGAGYAAVGAAVATANIGDETDTNKVRAYIDNSTVTSNNGGITLSGVSDSMVFNISAGLGVAVGGVAVEGSVSVNNINNEIAAKATDSTLTAKNDISFTSRSAKKEQIEKGALQYESDDTPVTSFDGGNDNTDPGEDPRPLSSIQSLAGSIAYGGGAGIGAAVATNNIGNKLDSVVAGSTVTSTQGDVELMSNSEATIGTISGAIAGSGSFSVAGAVSLNEIDNEILSYVSNSTVGAHNITDTIIAGDVPGISIDARDESTIRSISGGLGLSATGAIGGGAAYNDIGNTIMAYVDPGSTLTTEGSVIVASESDATIETISAGGGLAKWGAASGSVSINLIENDVEAYIQGGSPTTVTADDNVYVLADSDNIIHSYGGALSGGLMVGAAGAVVTNLVENTTKAYVNHATVNAKGTGDTIAVKTWDSSGTESTENIRGLFVIADTDEEIEMYSGSVAASLGVGLSGQVSVSKVSDTTEAYIAASTVNSSSDYGRWVKVKAHQDTDLGELYAGGLSIGGVAVGGAVDRTSINNTTRAFISDSDESGDDPSPEDSSVYAKGVEVKSQTKERYSPIIAGASLAGGIAVAGAVSVVDIDNDNDAFIKNSDVSSRGDLRVVAIDDAKIDTMAGAVSLSAYAGAGGSVAVNSIKNTTRARSVGAHLNATGETRVKAETDDRIITRVGTAAVGGLGGVAGAVPVNTIETTTEAIVGSSSSRNAKVNQDSDFKPGGAYSLGSGQKVLVKADNFAKIEDNAGALGVGAGGIGASIDVAGIRNRTVAEIGNKSRIYARGDVDIEAMSDRDVDSEVGAIGGGLLGLSGAISAVSVGSPIDSDGASEFNNDLRSQVNSDIATQDLKVNGGDPAAAKAKQKVDAMEDPSVDDALDTGADTSDKVTAAYVADASGDASKAVIESGGNVTIESSNTYDVDVETGQIAVGVVGVGTSTGVARVNNKTKAYVGNRNEVKAAGNVTIEASDKQKSGESVVDVFSGEVGFIAGEPFLDIGGASGELRVDTDTNAHLGNYAKISDADNVTITADQSANIVSDGYGLGVGAIAEGEMHNRAEVYEDVNAYIGSNATVGSNSQRVNSLAINATSDNLAESYSKAVAGGVAAGAAADADSYIEPETKAYIGNYSEVYTTGDINLSASSTNDVDSQIEGRSGGLAANGVMNAKAETKSIKTKAYTGSNSELHSDGNVKLDSQVVNTAYTKARGGVGGLLAGGGQEAFSQLNSVKTDSYIGSGGKVYAEDGTLEIKSTSYGNVESDTSFNTGGLITRNEVKSTSRILDSDTQARILGDADIRVSILDMKSNDEDLFAKAKSYSKTYAADSESDGTSEVDLDARSYAFVGANADIVAPEKISIIANQNSVKTEADSKTEIKVGLTGELSATADNNLTSKADVVTESGSTMETRDLFVKAYAPHFLENIYIRRAETEAQTVTYYVKEFVGYACKIVVDILCLGIFCDGEEVCEPVYEWVAHILHSEENRIFLGSKSVSNSIDFNSDVTVSGSGDPWLTVDAGGNVTADGITYTTDASQVTVDDVVNDAEGKITIDAKHGTVTGTATFNMNQAFGSVTITNNSSKYLNINDIEVINTNQTEPALQISGDSSGFNYTVNTNLYDTIIDISNNNIADADISLLGHILNPRGSTDIYNRGGDILAADSSAFIQTRELDLRADRGSVGLSGSPIYASLLVSDCCGVRKTSIDEVYGKKGVYLDLTASTKNNSILNVDVKDVTSGDDVHIDINDGFSTKITVVYIAHLTNGTSLYGFITGYNGTGFDFQDADTGEVTTIAWADLVGFGTTVRPANVPADSTFNVDDVLAAGDVTIDATDSVTLNVEGAITSGLKDIDFTIGSGGDISGNLFDYTVAVTGTEVEIEDLKHDGGNINIQTGSLVGDGTLRVLDGYAHVDITNNSNLDLTLNDIDINDRINGQITVNSDTDVQSNEYDSIQVEKYGYETGMITVSNTGDADILLKGQLLNSSGTTSLSAASGSILKASASHLIAAKDINLTATGGHIGGSYVRTDVGTGKIDADATHDIDLTEVDGDMRVGEITSASGDVTLVADDSIVDADDDSDSDINGADINLTAQNGGIGASTNHLDINSSNSGAGEVTATAESSVYVTETIGNMNVNQVTSNSGDVALKTSAGDINLGTINATSGDTELVASGSILDADNTAASNINSINIDLTAQPGSIGVSSNHLDIDLSGALKALADQGVYITEVDGDMNLDEVTSNTSDVTLIADDSMVDANDDEESDVNGVDINLTAQNGGIGASDNHLDIDSSNPTAGQVTARAQSSIYVTETVGDMNVDEITSNTSDVTLIADNSIVDVNNDGDSDVNGVNIDLTAENGAIGASDNDLDIDSSNTADGLVDAWAEQSIYVTETAGDMNVNEIKSNSGDVRLTAPDGNINIKSGTINSTAGKTTLVANGSILDASNNAESNINAVNIDMTAENGSIGASDNHLDIDSSNASPGLVNALAYLGIYLTEVDGDLNVGQIQSQTDGIVITSDGSILNGYADESAVNLIGKNITLDAINGSIGEDGKRLVSDSDGTFNMEAATDIYLEERIGDFVSDRTVAETGLIDIIVTNGNGAIDQISAPESVKLLVNGVSLSVNRVDSAAIDFFLTQPGGHLSVNDAFISDSVTVKSENIDLYNVMHTVSDRPLHFNMMGAYANHGDWWVAENINVHNIESDAYIVFDEFHTENGYINAVVDRLELLRAIVGTKTKIFNNFYEVDLEYKFPKEHEESDPLVTRYVPFYMIFSEDGKLETDTHPNLFVKKSFRERPPKADE